MADFPVAKKPRTGHASTLVGASNRLGRIGQAIGSATVDALEQRRAFILWPFAAIAGLIAYKISPHEPDPLHLVVGALVVSGAAFAMRRHHWSRPLLALVALFWFGACLLPLHGALFGTRMLEDPAYGTYSARIEAVLRDDGRTQRWLLSNIRGEPEWAVPDIRLGRVTVTQGPRVSTGDMINARIRFYPVPPPAVPGGYDSQFISYFDGIGAYGSVLGDLTVIEADAQGIDRLIANLRRSITEKIVAHLGARIGGIAAALVTGDQSRIAEADRDVMAEAGIAHVLSISGLHLTLVAGTMFAVVRLGLALSHSLTQRVPIKKIAAFAGIVTALAYMIISGMVIPAVRSTIMLALVFAAVIAGRQALTMRNVAIAALIIIVFEPSSVFRASFQLSFAAVVALIGAYELARARRDRKVEGERSKIGALVRDVGVTSIIAGLATVIFTAYHFQQTAPFGVLGNLMVMPIVSFVMMPAALLGTLLMPLGLEGPALTVLGLCIRAMLWCANFVRTLSGGFDPSPILAPTALLIAMAALGWFAFFRGKIRLYGPLATVPLIALLALEQAPDILIADGSQALAVRHQDHLALIAGRNNTFATNVWSERYIETIADEHSNARCDSLGCIIQSDQGFTLALVKDGLAFAEDCGIADIVVTRIHAPRICRETTKIVVDESDLLRFGAYMIDWNGSDAPVSVRTGIKQPDRVWRPQAQ